MNPLQTASPWWHERMMWLVVGGPAVVVVAALIVTAASPTHCRAASPQAPGSQARSSAAVQPISRSNVCG
mgnify:CR=1 FL=1